MSKGEPPRLQGRGEPWPWPLLLLGALALTCGGCSKEQGQRFECRCQFLTDYDDSSAQAVEICASSADQAAGVAKGCAQSAAPAPIQSCSCAAAKSTATGACTVGDCQVREHKP